MDFLNRYGAGIDCRKKKVKFNLENEYKFTFGKSQVLSMMISNVKARKMLNKRCVGYLAYMGNKANAKLASSVGGTPLVCEFLDLFYDNLLRLAPDREVDFSVKLA